MEQVRETLEAERPGHTRREAERCARLARAEDRSRRLAERIAARKAASDRKRPSVAPAPDALEAGCLPLGWQLWPVVYVLAVLSMPGACKLGRASSWWGADVRAAGYGARYGLPLARAFTLSVAVRSEASRLEADAHAHMRVRRIMRDGARELFAAAPQVAAALLRRRARELGIPSLAHGPGSAVGA